MNQPATDPIPAIDREACVACGMCVVVCPRRVLTQDEDGKALVRTDRCFACGHCQAACPSEAITVQPLDPDTAHYATFEADTRWQPFGKGDTAQLVRLLGSRRSTRRFKPDLVPRDLLHDLVKVGLTAPTGTNCQPWHFTIAPTPDQMARMRGEVAEYFTALNAKAEKAWLRGLLRLIGKPALARYYHGYYPLAAGALRLWEDKGVDLLFHGAPAAIVISCRDDASTGTEDALLAAQNMMLAAHTRGLGSCLIGFAVWALMTDTARARRLGVPEGYTPRAVLALGTPDERYARTIVRRTPKIHWMDR